VIAEADRRFYLPDGVQADALDQIISGIVEGTINEAAVVSTLGFMYIVC
jgi:hypothetical protein